MLISKIRTGVKTPWARGILFLFLITLFGGFGITQVIPKLISGRGNGIGMINGQEISRALFERKKQQAEEQIAQYYRRFGQAASWVMQQQGLGEDPQATALQSIIQATLLNQTADTMKLFLSPEYVKIKVQDPYFTVSKLYSMMPPDIINQEGRINVAAFNQFLATHDLTPFIPEFQESLRQDMVVSIVDEAFWAPQFALDEVMAAQTMERKFSILRVPLSQMIDEERAKGATLGEIKAFFDEQNTRYKRYYIPAKRNGTRWIFQMSDFGVKVSDKEVEDHYNRTKRTHFIDTPAQVSIREIIIDNVKEKGWNELKKEVEQMKEELVQDPAQFPAYAKKYSLRKETAANGGLVGFFKRGDKDKEIEQAAFRLKTDGEISPIIQIKNGYAIIQRVGRKEATFKPLSKEVKTEIVKQLQEKKFSRDFARMAMAVIKQKEKGKDEETLFAQFVKKYKGKEETVDAVSKEAGPLATRLFALKKRGDKVAYISEGKGYILELGDQIKKTLPPFDLIQSYVEKDFYRERARKELTERLKHEKNLAFKSGKLKAPAGAKIETTDWISTQSSDKLKELFERGIPQDIMLLDKKGGVVTALSKDDGFVVRLDDMRPVANEDAVQRAKIKTGARERLRGMFSAAFIASLQRDATIKFDVKSEQRNDLL